ncbi:hypothetical protein TNCV_1685841 [Trichonephila clavipes]|nr:hypothetical protein TNCV_1685841 [Trichonephila clavipes]
MSSVQSDTSLSLHPAGKNGYCGTENISHRYYKNKGVFFSVMSRNASDKVIAESSPVEKLKLSPLLLRYKNQQIWLQRESCMWGHNVGQSYTIVRFRCGYCQLIA